MTPCTLLWKGEDRDLEGVKNGNEVACVGVCSKHSVHDVRVCLSFKLLLLLTEEKSNH